MKKKRSIESNDVCLFMKGTPIMLLNVDFQML